VQILSIDLGTDILPALALGAEKPTKEVMKKQPRSHKERPFGTKLKQLQDFFGFFYVLYTGGWQWDKAYCF
jgi:sodium/potassium-transporting ATPase subunit alpha